MPPKSLQRVPASTRLPRALVGLVFARKPPFVGELYGFEPDQQRPQVSHSLHRLYFGLTFPACERCVPLALNSYPALDCSRSKARIRRNWCRLQDSVSGKTTGTETQATDAVAALSFPALNGGACRVKTVMLTGSIFGHGGKDLRRHL